MEIIRVEKPQLHLAADVVSTSFMNYPMFTFYFPDPDRRARYLPWYMRNALNCAYRYGDVLTTTGFEGVMFTLPPGHTKVSLWEYIRNGFFATPLVLGFRHYLRSMDCEAFVEKVHERIMHGRPHYYLWGLAVHPNHKRKGVGSALLSTLLKKADTSHLPIYLETHDENNIDYYKKAGFTLEHYQFIPNHALPIWCMVREPV